MKCNLRIGWRMVMCLALAMISAAPALAQQDGPTPYPDEKDKSAWPGKGPVRVFKWMTDNRNFFWTRRETDQGKIVFVGDSLIGNWKKPLMDKEFPGMKIANRGIGGDVSRGVLFRFKEDVLDLNPAAVVICIGTNDLSAHAKPSDVESNFVEILELAKAHNPDLPVIINLIPPRDSEKAPTKPGAQKELNERLSKLTEGRPNVTIVDTFTSMADAEGKPQPEFFNQDKLHISPAGYDKWAELLKPELEKVVKKEE